MASETTGINYITELSVNEFPALSIGLRFRFAIAVFTSFADQGVISPVSDSFILANVPDKPSQPPTRNTATNEFVVAVDIIQVPGIHGSPIVSYNVEIDDGQGGPFTELQGQTTNSLNKTAQKSVGIVKGLLYRFRYRAKNEVGFR